MSTIIVRHIISMHVTLQGTYYMIKNILSFFSAIVVCFACTGNATNNIIASTPEAEQKLRDDIARHPDSLLLKENLIQYFRENNNLQQAITETEKAIQKDSVNARLWDIKATLEVENKDTANAIASFQKAIAIKPQPVYLISLGSLYAQTKNPLALSLADKLLSDSAAKAGKEALFIKGFYYSYAGQKEKAISYFDSCLVMDYTNTMAYREKAICLYDLQKYEAAIIPLKKAVALQSTYDEGYYWLARCYEKLNQRQEAVDNYHIALQIDPDYAEAKEGLSRLGAL